MNETTDILLALWKHPVNDAVIGCLGVAYFGWALRTVTPYRPETWGRGMRTFFLLVYLVSWVASRVTVPVAVAYPFWADPLPFEIRLLISGSFLAWFAVMRLKQGLPLKNPLDGYPTADPLPNPPGPSRLDP